MSVFKNLFWNKIIVIAFLSISLYSCKKLGLCKDENLSIVKHSIDTKNLRINGYHYTIGETGYNIQILFGNGVTLKFSGSKNYDSIAGFEQSIITGDLYKGIKNVKYFWGSYKISDNIIFTENWKPKQFGCATVLHNNATIINDSTFVWLGTNDTMHLKQFLKPDSTNSFVQ